MGNEKRSIHRRGFLRMCWLAAAGAAAAACGQATQTPAPEPAPTIQTHPAATLPASPTSTPIPVEGQISLSGRGGDAWGYEKPVFGKITGFQDCRMIKVKVNGKEIAADLKGDRFSAAIPIAGGENRIIAVCQHADGKEDQSKMVEYIGKIMEKPTAVISISASGNQVVLDSKDSLPAETDGVEIVNTIWSARGTNPAPVQAGTISIGGAGDISGDMDAKRLIVSLPAVDGEYYFNLRVVDQKGREDSSTNYVVVEQGTARLPDYDKENPAWVENSIVYGVIPRLFGEQSFQSIRDQLDTLKELGVNALWLAPINMSPPGDYGYAVIDYFKLSSRYGTEEDFREMVQAAHERGIRVLMDFVPNHTSDQHPYYRDAINEGMDSPYWNFYDRDKDGMPTYYFNWTYLPNLNYSNPEVERWITEAFSYWVREFDVDGFRVDVAWGVKLRKPDFWPRWRRALKRIKPDLLLLAEASARDSYYFDNGFDVAYDWTDQLGHWAWERAFETESLLLYNLDSALTHRPEGYHPDALIFRFLNNNDTGERFITRYGPERTRVATALLLTLPGVPCIYTGDEVGEAYVPYSDPPPLTWEEKCPGLREYHQQLISLRKEIPSLHSRLWQTIEVEPHSKVYAYLRYQTGNAQPVLVLLNFYKDDTNAEVSLPKEFQDLVSSGVLVDYLSDEQIAIKGTNSVRIPMHGYSARILAPRDYRQSD